MMELKFPHIKLFLSLLLLVLTESVSSQIGRRFWWLNNGPKTKVLTTVTSTTTVPSSPVTTSPTLQNIICCECVQFYLCLNGTILSDGSNMLDLRIGLAPATQTDKPSVINVDICPTDDGDFQICCPPPDVDPSCLQTASSPTTTVTPMSTPHPDSQCECVVYNDCKPYLVVSNGLGNTSIVLPNGRIASHDKCHHSLEVCCLLNFGHPELSLGDVLTELQNNASTTHTYGESCPECVSRSLCDSEGYIIEDGSGLVSPRSGVGIPNTFAMVCPHDSSLVCCRLREDTRHPEHAVTPAVDPVVTPEPTIVAKLKPKLCGTRNFKGVGTRILGFRESQTQFGEFPWVATLLKKQLLGNNIVPLFGGGASLIHRRAVLTAAHKINGLTAEDLWVRVGEWDVASEMETLPHQDILVEEIIIHPRYKPGPLHHDVALLILKNEAKLDDHVGTICISSSADNIDTSSCVINGWGVDEFGSGNYQKLMKSVQLPLVDKQTCQSLLRETRLSKYFRLHSSFICAGGEKGVDACKGDGGGPLACRSKSDPSRYYQVGITAWGIGCGTENVPGVYVDVAEHFEWINSCLRNKNLEVESSSTVRRNITVSRNWQP